MANSDESVVVVGGGASGALVSMALLARGARVVLAEPSGRPGPGLAYGAADPRHLLNSPAAAMTADPAAPADFVDWCAATGAPVAPGDFAPRRRYGAYLADRLAAAAAAAGDRFALRPHAVTRLASGGAGPVRVHFADGTAEPAAHAVLCVGNDVPAWPPGLDAGVVAGPRCVADPWAAGALDAVPAGEPVLLIGTGLTAVDVTLTLAARGRRAPVVAVSRHGLLPRTHRRAGAPAALPPGWPPAPGPLAGLLRQVRAAVAATGDWRAVVDGMRPVLDPLWFGLTPAEQRRFLRLVGRVWETHRHRMAPSVADRLDRMRAAGELGVHGGGVRRLAGGGTAVRAWIGAAEAPRRFGAVVNCSGPGPCPDSAGPLVRRLVAAGLAAPDRHRLGLAVDRRGALLSPAGQPHRRLWAVGPLRRGVFWETTAVPEIRAQAYALAELLVGAGAAPRQRAASGAPVPLA